MTRQPPFFRLKPALVLLTGMALAGCISKPESLPTKPANPSAQGKVQTEPQPATRPSALPASPAAQAASEPASAPKAQPTAPAPGGSYAARLDAMAFADELARRHRLDPQWVRQIIGQSRFNATVARLMQPPTKTFVKSWRVYRSRFIDPVRIAAGVRFWQANGATLARAEKEYGVPAEIIVGIIGVETIYGRDTGTFRVMDALMTLGFDFPANHPRAAERSAYFKSEVEQFVVLQSQNKANALDIKGSYAGAMGLPQFMPSSWAKYAVDFDGDGTIDLWKSPPDIIGSVASYFKAHHWQSGMPTHYPVTLDRSRLDMEALMAPDIVPTFSVASFTDKGAVLKGAALQHKGPLALIELLNGADAPGYVAGTENFYAITRYNWSSYYAMAVIELGREVAARVKPRD